MRGKVASGGCGRVRAAGAGGWVWVLGCAAGRGGVWRGGRVEGFEAGGCEGGGVVVGEDVVDFEGVVGFGGCGVVDECEEGYKRGADGGRGWRLGLFEVHAYGGVDSWSRSRVRLDSAWSIWWLFALGWKRG
jgi:hypothetical protein